MRSSTATAKSFFERRYKGCAIPGTHDLDHFHEPHPLSSDAALPCRRTSNGSHHASSRSRRGTFLKTLFRSQQIFFSRPNRLLPMVERTLRAFKSRARRSSPSPPIVSATMRDRSSVSVGSAFSADCPSATAPAKKSQQSKLVTLKFENRASFPDYPSFRHQARARPRRVLFVPFVDSRLRALPPEPHPSSTTFASSALTLTWSRCPNTRSRWSATSASRMRRVISIRRA